MSFDSLRAITFHHDYELALKEVVGPDRSAPAPTNEAGSMSVDMMVRVADGVHLVMHESVALALASDDREASDWAQHAIRHELCHVAVCAFKRELVAKHPDTAANSGFEGLLAPLAEALWDEFYANTYSTGPRSDLRTSLDLLRNSVPAIHAEVTYASLEYRSSADLNRLLGISAPKVKFIAQRFGTRPEPSLRSAPRLKKKRRRSTHVEAAGPPDARTARTGQPFRALLVPGSADVLRLTNE